MSHWIGTTSPADAGMNDFKECLKNLRDGHADEALQHARRALGVAPKNPFYLSYTGLLAALSEKRFGDAETLCREALGMKHNHAQLYLNLAEVYYRRAARGMRFRRWKKGWYQRDAISGFGALWRKSESGERRCSRFCTATIR